VSSDDALTDYEETVALTIFTPFISFLVVLISCVALLSLVAFFTDTGNIPFIYSTVALAVPISNNASTVV